MLVTIPSWLLWALGIPVGVFLYIIIGGLLANIFGYLAAKADKGDHDQDFLDFMCVAWPVTFPILFLIMAGVYLHKGTTWVSQITKRKKK